jgi:hypothetical protein
MRKVLGRVTVCAIQHPAGERFVLVHDMLARTVVA